ncbi:MAG: SRPBCC family protein [Acidimicrobiales bacterium]
MSCNERTIDATPEQIWEVLADPLSYDRWVVGAKDIRTADGTWPEPGSRLHHTVGVGPLHLKDNTKVLESEPPHRLVMEARGRPLGIARIEMRLEAVGDATRVTMIEYAVRPSAVKAMNPALDPLIHSRNTETLRRLDAATHERLEAAAP